MTEHLEVNLIELPPQNPAALLLVQAWIAESDESAWTEKCNRLTEEFNDPSRPDQIEYRRAHAEWYTSRNEAVPEILSPAQQRLRKQQDEEFYERLLRMSDEDMQAALEMRAEPVVSTVHLQE